MKEGECVVGPIHFLCLDCWYAYFQSLDEIASAPFRGRCSNCRHNIGPLIPCKSEHLGAAASMVGRWKR